MSVCWHHCRRFPMDESIAGPPMSVCCYRCRRFPMYENSTGPPMSGLLLSL